MASDGGGKMKGRKGADGSKPYARRQSLMGRVKDSVKDMLAPSWLVDLVSSVKKTTPPNSPSQLLSQSDQVPASTNHMPQVDMRPSQPVVAAAMPQPMATPQLHFQQQMQQNPHQSRPEQASHAAAGEAFNSDSLPFSHFNKFPTLAHPVINGDDNSEVSEYSASTSVCSSTMPNPDRKDYQREVLKLNENKIAQLRKELAGSITPSKELEAQNQGGSNVESPAISSSSFLWTTEVTTKKTPKPQSAAKAAKPAFNVSIFGSPIVSPEKSSLFASNQSFQDSLYYPGRTTFGGAAAHRRNRGFQNSPYQGGSLSRKQVTAKPLNTSASRPGVTSSTAKKILDTLEKMSTPLNDAKKMPSYASNVVDSPLTFTPTLYRRKSTPARALGANYDAPPVRGIQTPVHASIGKNLARPPIHQMPTNVNAQASVSSIPEKEPVKDNSSYASGGGGGRPGKMKRDRGGAHYTRGQEEEEVEEPAPDLPTAFTLPSAALTGLQFSLTSSSAASVTPSPPALSPVVPDRKLAPVSSPAATSGFTFSSPIPKTDYSLASNSSSLSPPAQYRFSSPISMDEEKKNEKSSTAISSAPVMSFSASVSSGLKLKSQDTSNSGGNLLSSPNLLKQGSVLDALSKAGTPDTGLLKKGSVTEALGIKANTELKKGSVMDVLSGSVVKPSETEQPSLSSLFKVEEGSWECSMCMLRNGPEKTKCIACETAKPASVKKTEKQPPAASSTFGSMFKPEEGTQISTSLSSEPSLSSLFPKSAGSWDCPTCMIQNKSDALKCPACDTQKPGSAASVPGGSEQKSLAEMFKKPEGNWECSTCMVDNKSTATKCIACETPKPGVKPATNFTSPGGFKFGDSGGFSLPGVTDKTSTNGPFKVSTEGTSQEKTTGGFKFGASNSTDSSSNGGFQFGAPIKETQPLGSGFKVQTSTSDETSKPQAAGFQFKPSSDISTKTDSKEDTPKVKETPTESKPLVGGFNFKAPDTSVKSDGKTLDSSAESSKPSSTGGFKFSPTSTGGNATATGFGLLTKGTDSKSSDNNNKPALPSFQSGKSEQEPSKLQSTFQFGQPSSTSNSMPKFGSKESALSDSGSFIKSSQESNSASNKLEEKVATTPVGFSFSAPNIGSPASSVFGSGSNTTVTKSGADNKTPVANLFTFGAKPAEQSSSGFSLKTSSSEPTFNTQSLFSNKAPLKRIGDDSSESPSKKGKNEGAFNNGDANKTGFGGFSQNSSTNIFGSSGNTAMFGGTSSSSTGVSSSNGASTFGTSGFQFGQPSKPAESASATAAPALFQFGQSKPTEATTTAANPPAAVASSPFVFGQQPQQPAAGAPTPAAPAAFNFSGAAAPTSFNFGATGSTGASSVPFQFGATAPAPTSTNPFNATSTSTTRRPIKKATRKLRK